MPLHLQVVIDQDIEGLWVVSVTNYPGCESKRVMLDLACGEAIHAAVSMERKRLQKIINAVDGVAVDEEAAGRKR